MGVSAEKVSALRWRGMLDEFPLMVRCMVAAVLAVAGAAFSFTQLGFVGFALPDGTNGYAVSLLAVAALGALLLGAPAGAALGLVAGGVLLLHSQVLPLDYYELTYITPLTSVVLLGVCGALLGILFALALRKNPSQGRRAVRIVIICIAVSWLYSLAFASNVTASLAASLVEAAGGAASDASVQQAASSTAMQLGDMGLQAWATALLMVLSCLGGDLVARRMLKRNGSPGLRSVFGTWLVVVVALTFLALSAVSFGMGTVDALRDAEDAMRDNVGDLTRQMSLSHETSNLLSEIFETGEIDFDKVDEKALYDLTGLLEDYTILEDYTPERHGLVFIRIDEFVYACNDERYASDFGLESILSADALASLERSLETGRMERMVFGDSPALQTASQTEEAENGAGDVQPSIAYVFAQTSYEIPVISSDKGEYIANVDVIMIRNSKLVFSKRGDIMKWMTLASFVLLLGVSLVVIQLLNRVVARRIDEENAALASITTGKLDTRAEASGTREFESLSEGINTTVDALKGWIAEAEARMDAELAAARTVQESALPRTFPPFPDIPAFDVFASMDAAREVGGDFYDFFLVGDGCGPRSGKVAFVVADVSGKGMPAALFMMRAKALLRESVGDGTDLAGAVEQANAALCEGNDAGMFVTAWVGILDYGTGHVDYVNAGHNPPLLRRDGGWEWMRERSGVPLGLFELPYTEHSLECSAGDAFLLYTDGVTEAFDVNEELYGEERLLAVVEEDCGLNPRELVQAVRTGVAAYAEGAVQSDDITILAIEIGMSSEVDSEE